MLEQLLIENFAIIEKVDLRFERGMTVLTGETGAGKSIIIDALSMLTGARASSEMVRHGADKATLQAVFVIGENPRLRGILADNGIDLSDDELIIFREMTPSGRSSIRVNGVLVNLKTLALIGRYLVDIQGQHDMQQLLNADEHLVLLDNFGDDELAEKKAAYHDIYQKYTQLVARLRRIQTQKQDVAQKLDLLTFQRDELQNAALKPNEEDELLEARSKLSNFKKIADRLRAAESRLNDAGGAIDVLAETMQLLNDIATYDDNYATLAQNIAESYYTAQEVGRDLTVEQGALTYDEAELVAIDDRLALIHSLERKYGATVADVLAFQTQVEADLAVFEGDDTAIDSLLHEREQLGQQLKNAAQALHVARDQVARQLADDVNGQLADLLMTGAKFDVRLTPAPKFLASGHDQAAFFIQTNVGEGMAPLVKIASGGEAARVMLALKTTFATSQQIISIVFDEADTGVSGRVAQAMAKKMRTISANSQVLAITHLPQVAAHADHHFFIEKQTLAGRTTTTVKPVTDTQRAEAIALMLSGDTVTQTALENAQALLDDAHKEN